MKRDCSRRDWLKQSTVTLGALASTSALAATPRESRKGDTPFPISLNTSTIRGQKLPITRIVEIAAEAGYQGIEP